MGRGFLILLLAASTELFFLRAGCERDASGSPSGAPTGSTDPRIAHLGSAVAGVPRTQMDKYLSKWQPGQGGGSHEEAASSGETTNEDEVLDDDPAEDEIPPEMSSAEILSELSKSYDPLGGQMDVLLKAVKITDDESNRESRHWVEKSHQAIKAVHHVVAEATNDAQASLMRDGLRLDEGIRHNLKNETAKMYALELDPSTREKIHLQVNARQGFTAREREIGRDERIQLPPPPAAYKRDDLIGKRVMCNNQYEGENHDVVHGHYGVVVASDPETKKYRVRLKHWMGADFMPLLARAEFDLVPGEELDGVELPEDNTKKTKWADMFPSYPGEEEAAEEDSSPSPEWVAAMDSYADKPVLVHHLPEHIITEDDGSKDRYLDKMGTVIDYRHVGDMPEFRIKMEKEDPELRRREREKQRPWLHLDLDFNFVLELKGKEVQLNMPNTGIEGTKDYKTAIKDRGMVSEWHPENGGYYEVNVTAHEEKVKPAQIQHLDGLEYIPPSGEQAMKIMSKTKLAQSAKFGAGFHDSKFDAGGKKIKTKAEIDTEKDVGSWKGRRGKTRP